MVVFNKDEMSLEKPGNNDLVQVIQKGPSKICGRQPLKNLK